MTLEIKVASLNSPTKDFNSEKMKVEENILFTVKTYLDDARENLNQKVQQLQYGPPPPCLCAVLSPLVKICSFFGLFPVCLDKGNCVMTYKCISKPGIVNVVWLTIIFVSSCTLYIRVVNYFNLHIVNGTDFYTFGLGFSIQIAASVVIFLCGNFRATRFVQAWHAFHQVVSSMQIEEFRKLKARIYIIPAYLIHEMLLNALTSFWGLYGNPAATAIIVVMPFAGFLVTFIPGLLTCSYVIMLWIIGEHFKTITLRVGEVLGDNSISTSFDLNGKGSAGVNELAEKLMKLRLQHEELAVVVRHLEDAFGIQILAIFLATSFGFVAGVYGFIISTQGLTDDARFTEMAAAYSFENVYGGIRILLILVASQFLMNSAKAPANILNGIEGKSYQVQIQVDRFLSKLGNFPVQVSCCDIFRLGNCFLAAAASNVVTYVLVLMQFRLDKCTKSTTTASLSNYSSVPGI